MKLLKAIRRWKMFNRTVAELSSLTDRELQDIGILRSDIYRLASRTD